MSAKQETRNNIQAYGVKAYVVMGVDDMQNFKDLLLYLLIVFAPYARMHERRHCSTGGSERCAPCGKVAPLEAVALLSVPLVSSCECPD